ncbi:flagellar biosynthetic protein FliR [Jiella sp. M17.18]|uniref:flagellar biosynthetic protein FliR n=1 Tax=Jiella sp. M17.18 TaxID=3234247 RepID=UPI0034E03AB7
MITDLPDVVLGIFVIFCRIGSCLLLLPGVSSSRIPTQIRLFLALAISLALSPTLMPIVEPLVRADNDNIRLQLMVTELLNGLFIGLLGRSFMIALEFAGHVVANSIGMGQALGVPIEDREAAPAISSLITMTATTLIFVLNLHAEIARALVASYNAMPPAAGFAARGDLRNIVDNLDQAFHLCLRLSSPFILYAVIVNFAIGLANKLTPTIPIYFISLPFVLAGGIVLFGYSIGDFLIMFMNNFQQWVFRG